MAKASAAGQVPYATAPNILAMLSAVAYRAPTFNAAATAIETLASRVLRQPPLYASAVAVNLAAYPTFNDIVTQSITTVGGMVLVFATFRVNETKTTVTSTVITHWRRLRRDITDLLAERVFSSDIVVANIANVPEQHSATCVFLETPVTGTYVYRLALSYTADAGTVGTPTGDAEIMVLELAP